MTKAQVIPEHRPNPASTAINSTMAKRTLNVMMFFLTLYVLGETIFLFLGTLEVPSNGPKLLGRKGMIEIEFGAFRHLSCDYPGGVCRYACLPKDHALCANMSARWRYVDTVGYSWTFCGADEEDGLWVWRKIDDEVGRNCSAVSKPGFCEGIHWGSGTRAEVYEYSSAWTSLSFVLVGLLDLWRRRLGQTTVLHAIGESMLVVQGLGSFLHHLFNRQSIFFGMIDFVPMIILTQMYALMLSLDLLRGFNPGAVRRALKATIVILWGCNTTLGLGAVHAPSVQDAVFFYGYMKCFVLLGFSYLASSSEVVSNVSFEDTAYEVNKNRLGTGMLTNKLSIDWSKPGLRRRFFFLFMAQSIVPGVLTAFLRNLVEKRCESRPWDANASWLAAHHLIACVDVFISDWTQSKVVDIELGIFSFTKTSPWVSAEGIELVKNESVPDEGNIVEVITEDESVRLVTDLSCDIIFESHVVR